MPSLTEHQASDFTKLLLIGDSGTGKTSALASLAIAGYKLYIIDLDNGLLPLSTILKRDKPEALKNVEYISLRDSRNATATGASIIGIPQAFPNTLKMLDNWNPEGVKQVGVNLGKPRTFGDKSIIVLDSLTMLGDAAFDWARAMNPSVKDNRQIYGMAQEAVENTLAMLTDPSFSVNVIVISHVRWVDRPDGTSKGYPSAIGAALSPKIAMYFNTTALAESIGSPPQKYITTVSTALIDLKNPIGFKTAPRLPLATALADYFKAVKE